MPLTVTFDTNTLISVVSPGAAQRGTGVSGATVRAAIQAGDILGFFSETLVTLEGIRARERADVLGKTRVVTETSMPSNNRINLAVGVRHVRNPLEPRFSARIQDAIALGMRALMAPARMDALHVKDQICPIYEPTGGIQELLRCMDRVNEMATMLARRGVGNAIAIQLGVELTKRAGVSTPELWLQGLVRAQKSERGRVAKAIREWADGDSIAAHYGFGIGLFCSEDTRRRSALAPRNRKWLSENFGVRFVTLEELPGLII